MTGKFVLYPYKEIYFLKYNYIKETPSSSQDLSSKIE